MPTGDSKRYAAEVYCLGPITLRVITAAEAAVLGPGLTAIDPWRRLTYSDAALTDYLIRPDPAANRFAIYAGSVLAGAVSVREPWLHGPYLELLGLLPSTQGRGIGHVVMRWFEEEAPPGWSNLWVLCSDFNTRALAFYERCGFRQVAPLDSLIGEGFTEILLRKQLFNR